MINTRTIRVGALALILWVVVAGCDGAHNKMQSVQADFGDIALVLEVPDDLLDTPIVNGGIRLARRDAGQTRRSYEIMLVPAVGTSPVPVQKTFRTGGTTVRYGIDHVEGGSGGSEVTLIAERRCNDLLVRLRLNLQAEDDETPDLDSVLQMLATARCSPRATRYNAPHRPISSPY